MGTVEQLFGGDYREQHDLRLSAVTQSRPRDARRYSTGLINVDDAANMMQPGWLCVIGAREGQGKTALAERIAMANAYEHRVLFVSLDMREDTVRERFFSKSMQVGVDHYHHLAETNDPQYKFACKRIEDLDILLWRPRKGEKSIKQIIARAEAVTAAIVIIDYTRLIDGWDYGKRAADIVDYLTDWTQDSGTATILLTQLRDEAVNRRPHNGHIQDTGQIAQRADRVTLIYRPYHGRGHKDTIAEILTTKNRGGPAVTNHVGWIGETKDFYAFDAEEEANAKCCSAKRKATPIPTERKDYQ